jgi:8-oxo-dGTP diphosphatase
MAFEDKFRLSSHAVITDEHGKVLLLKQTYDDQRWGLPGGALDPGETIHEALFRECIEELGTEVEISYLSGVYYHSALNAQAFIFRCRLPPDPKIVLSEEHSEYRYFGLKELSPVQRQRVKECIEFNGLVSSAKF